VLERYIIKQVFGVFLLVLVTLTGILWLTQALERIDLLTSQGQTLLLFLRFTALSLPGMLIVITPVALFIAIVYTLNRLNQDSELIVISASGASRWFLMRPVLFAGVLVTLFMYSASLYLVPYAWRELRILITEVRSDILTKIISEGSFTSPESNLVFHIRSRGADETLHGVLVHDARDPGQELTYLAEQARLIREGDNAVLIMTKGSVQQKQAPDAGDPNAEAELNMVVFDRYVLDLSQFTGQHEVPAWKARERFMGELLNPAPDDPRYLRAPGKFRSELNERLTGPLYTLAYAFIALAAVGFARSNRERRFLGILGAVVAVLAVRLSGFAMVNVSAKQAWATAIVFAIPVGTILLAGAIALGVFHGTRIAAEAERRLDRAIMAIGRVLSGEAKRARARAKRQDGAAIAGGDA